MDTLDLFFFLADVMATWRFYLPLAAGLGLVALIYWLIPVDGVRIALAIPVILIAFLIGIMWQWRSRRKW